MPKMIVSRIDERNGHGFFKLYLDGTMIGKIGSNEEMVFDILPGKHSLYCKCGVLSTHKISFKVNKENRKFEILSDDNALSFIYQILTIKDKFLNVRQRCI